MAPQVALLCTVAIFCALSLQSARGQVVVTVHPTLGNDSLCQPAQEVNETASTAQPATPCATINRALGDVACSKNSTCLASTSDADQLSDVVVMLENGVHRLTGCVYVGQAQNVRFISSNPGLATIKCRDFPNNSSYDNIEICNSTNVSFTGIRFENCGPKSPNVFVSSSSGVEFDGCHFTNNSGAVVQMQFTTGVELRNSVFVDNDNLEEIPPDNEADETTVDDLFRAITKAGAFTFFHRNAVSIDVTISNCTFRSNIGTSNDPNNSRPVLLKAGGHGGAVLLRLANIQDSTFTIEDSEFENNVAEVDGGAVFISISQGFSSNQIVFRNNRFVSNKVENASGGAISLNSFSITYNNMVRIEDCDFVNNSGNAGGAISVALYDSDLDSTNMPDAVNITRCNFSDNSAFNEGTAVGLFSLVHVDQVGFPVSFEDCTFEDNLSLEDNEDTSAVAAFRFPTIFRGHNYFLRNRGGGITLLNTRMQASGKLLFDSNVAVFGGGIAMDDRCLLEISPGLNMTFVNNIATESGAGIYVEFPPIRFVVDIFNRLCFIQYNDGSGTDRPPQSWTNVTILFMNNMARLSGASIYASDMQQCGWLGNDFTNDSTIIFNPPPTLDDSNYPFQYVNNSLMPEGISALDGRNQDLATAPAEILVEVEVEVNSSEYTLVQPGETLPINLLAVDQVGNSREAVWSLEAPQQDANLDALSAMNDTFPYQVPRRGSLPGLEGVTGDEDNFTSSFNLTFSLLRTLGNTNTLKLTVRGCHPGYVLNENEGICICDTSNSDILRCDDNKRYIYLREGIWGGVRIQENGARMLVTERVQPGYINCRRQGRLPGCLFKFDNGEDQCRSGREGTLCGECIDGYGVTLDLQSCTSISCNYGIGLFVALCVIVIVLSTVVLVFNISIPNELKGFFFYAQVIGLVFRPYVVVQNDTVSRDFSAFLNLLGISVPLPLCLSTAWKAHYVALLGYVSPILVILPLVVFAIGAQFIQKLASHSTLKGLTFICLIVYKYTADTAAIFVSCTSTAYGVVFQYDGSQSCVSLEFGFFALLGLFLAAFFVIPTPFAVGYICIKRPRRFEHYSDVLTEGLKDKHRWWGGWEIGRRLLFVIISYFVVLARPSLILFFMSLAALAVLIVHLFTKPFKKMYINIIEAAILLNLLMVTAAFLDPSNSPVPKEFGLTLVVLPYIYAVGFIIYKLCSLLGKKMMKTMNLDLQEEPNGDVTRIKKPSMFKERTTSEDRSSPITVPPQSNTQTQDSGIGSPASTSASPGGGTGGGDTRASRRLSTNGTRDRGDSRLREPLLED